MIRWDPEKSVRLKRERGVSFEEILQAEVLCAIRHSGRPGQRVLLVRHGGYVWAVPYVLNGDEVFLKTLFPSRKYTRLVKEGKLP
ncbi:MAG: hypothetical protein A2049_06525 [Elusimicrobia bacterium GWA2_62_23]|nr:MAG: hypothetical protein A2049_06525 [Elusimicrobia bacterium GWA2_62_23]OGR71636.1 MAG: hypothetical protein A2179_07005 [Elusimicrobia bacterium GWC2_63_65]